LSIKRYEAADKPQFIPLGLFPYFEFL
jgi:hypothetical protein